MITKKITKKEEDELRALAVIIVDHSSKAWKKSERPTEDIDEMIDQMIWQDNRIDQVYERLKKAWLLDKKRWSWKELAAERLGCKIQGECLVDCWLCFTTRPPPKEGIGKAAFEDLKLDAVCTRQNIEFAMMSEDELEAQYGGGSLPPIEVKDTRKPPRTRIGAMFRRWQESVAHDIVKATMTKERGRRINEAAAPKRANPLKRCKCGVMYASGGDKCYGCRILEIVIEGNRIGHSGSEMLKSGKIKLKPDVKA